jgi:hypothetical protein
VQLALGAIHGSHIIRQGDTALPEIGHDTPLDRPHNEIEEEFLKLTRGEIIEAYEAGFGQIPDGFKHSLPRNGFVNGAPWRAHEFQEGHEDICRRSADEAREIEAAECFGSTEPLNVTHDPEQRAAGRA